MHTTPVGTHVRVYDRFLPPYGVRGNLTVDLENRTLKGGMEDQEPVRQRGRTRMGGGAGLTKSLGLTRLVYRTLFRKSCHLPLSVSDPEET